MESPENSDAVARLVTAPEALREVGERIVESLEIMATCVHPGALPELEALHREAVRPFPCL